MNFSSNMNPPHKRRGTYWRDLVVGILIGVLIVLVGLAYILFFQQITTKVNANGTPVVGPVEPAVSVPPVTIPNDPTPSPRAVYGPGNLVPWALPDYRLLCV